MYSANREKEAMSKDQCKLKGNVEMRAMQYNSIEGLVKYVEW